MKQTSVTMPQAFRLGSNNVADIDLLCPTTLGEKTCSTFMQHFVLFAAHLVFFSFRVG
jgi:hypothetical protein